MSSVVQIQGLAAIQGTLREIDRRTANLKPILQEVGNIPATEAIMNIKRQTDIFGRPFVPLGEKTIHSYASKGGRVGSKRYERLSEGKKILIDSGSLLGTISVKADDTSVVVGTNAHSPSGFAYPLSHQFGSIKRNIPVRAFFPVEGSPQTGIYLTDKITIRIMRYLSGELMKDM